MLTHILTHIVCNEFEEMVGRWQLHFAEVANMLRNLKTKTFRTAEGELVLVLQQCAVNFEELVLYHEGEIKVSF